MPTCDCGRQFRAEQHLAQHQHAILKMGKSCENNSPSSKEISRAIPKSRDAWMWKGVQSHELAGTIDASALNVPPGSAKVSSTSGCDLICSYDWQIGEAGVLFPGCAPPLKKIALPVTLRPSKRNFVRFAKSIYVPRYPFEPLFQATEAMNPGFRFNDVDIICNRNSLRNLLLFCNERFPSSFRVNLLMIHNTLFIERCEPNATRMIQGSLDQGFGREFESACTSAPPGREASSAHHCALRYLLGDLSCVVRFEVDASYQEVGKMGSTRPADETIPNPIPSSFDAQLENLSINRHHSEATDSSHEGQKMRRAGLEHESTAAEIKSGTRLKPQGKFMPQLWFGRTPWLVRGVHSNGTFHKVSVDNVGASFTEWEEENQTGLQKLVAVLKQLRDIARGPGGGNCIAIFEKQPRSPTIKVFRGAKDRMALPEHMISRFWDP